MPFPFADGTGSPVLDELVGGPAAALTAVALVVAPGARASGWGARAAVALAAGWRGPRRVLLADLDLDQPVLHELAGVANEEGVIDLIEYGISVGRLIRSAPAGGYDFLPAGIFTPEPGSVLRHDGWSRVLMEVAARRGTLLAWVPSDADGMEAVVQRAGAVLVLAEPGEGRSVVERLPHPYAVLAVLTPPVAATEAGAAASTLAGDAAEPGAPEHAAEIAGGRVERDVAAPDDSAERAAAAEAAAADEAATAAEVEPAEVEAAAAGAAADEAAAAEVEAAADEGESAAAAATVAEVAAATAAAAAAAASEGEAAAAATVAEVAAAEATAAAAAAASEVEPAEAAAEPEPEPAADSGHEPASAIPGPATRPPTPVDPGVTDAAAREALAHELRDRQRSARLAGAASAPAGSPDTEPGTPTRPGPVPPASVSQAPPPAAASQARASASHARASASHAPPRPDTGADAEPEHRRRGPAPKPRAFQRYRHPLTWTLLVILLASLLAGAWHYLSGRLDPIEPAPQAAEPAPAAPAPAAPAVQNALPFVVAIEAHRELPVALNRVADLREIEPELLFHVEPLEREGALFYHVMAGPVPDSATALALRDTLIARGHKTGATPTDVRATPLAFVIGDYGTPALAEEQREVLRRLDIPGYVLLGEAADGRPLYRLYVGGFGTAAEADVIRQMLRSAGIRDSLIARTGSITAADIIGTEGDSASAGDSLTTTTGQQ